MRFLGLVAVVVIAIFATTFGVYYWLGGSSDTTIQVASPSSIPAVSNIKASNDPASEPDGAVSQEATPEGTSGDTPAKAENTAASGNAISVTSNDNDANGQQPTDNLSTQEQPGAEPPKAEESSPVKPSAPLVVARVVENTGDESTPSDSGDVPSFDVVRVEKSGEAILAGRAPAGSEVTVYDGDTPLGIVTADSRGQWVLILDIPLFPGSHSLGVTARLSDETQVDSADLVIVAVPEPQYPVQTAEDTGTPSVDEDAVTQSDAGDQEILAGSDDGIPVDNGDAQDNPITPSQVAVADTGVKDPIAVIVPRRGAGPARILQKPNTVGEGIGNGSLFLDSVDYDDDGRAVIGGRANAGAALIIYLDNFPIGEALTGDDGRWAMTPEDLVPVGLHRLRVDQVETGGRVLARVETPFSRAETVANHPDENFVTVQPGNSLWRIARTTYGQGTRYTVIYEINREQIRDPDLIYPGQIFRLPSDG